jgi:hypothetical protein
MAIVAKRQAGLPAGAHTGVIIKAEETKKVFEPSRGPEPTVEITIQPKWKAAEGVETLPVNCLFSPSLNGLSGLSKLLNRLGAHPKDGDSWDPSELLGTEVAFTSEVSAEGFARVNKDTIRSL